MRIGPRSINEIVRWSLNGVHQGVVFVTEHDRVTHSNSIFYYDGRPPDFEITTEHIADWWWTADYLNRYHWDEPYHGPYSNPLDATCDMIFALQELDSPNRSEDVR